MSRHLGAALTAFVDGELDHAQREEVLVHLAHCAPCRGDLALLRAVKASLRDEPGSAPEDLAARLLALPATPDQPALVARPRTGGHRPRVRRAAVGVGALALGFGGALVAAGSASQPVAPVDPASTGLVLEHVSTANEVPFESAEVIPAADPAPSR